MIYLGLDIDKVNTHVAWRDSETGEISAAYQCPPTSWLSNSACWAGPSAALGKRAAVVISSPGSLNPARPGAGGSALHPQPRDPQTGDYETHYHHLYKPGA